MVVNVGLLEVLGVAFVGMLGTFMYTQFFIPLIQNRPLFWILTKAGRRQELLRQQLITRLAKRETQAIEDQIDAEIALEYARAQEESAAIETELAKTRGQESVSSSDPKIRDLDRATTTENQGPRAKIPLH